jgi:hypothetical protein
MSGCGFPLTIEQRRQTWPSRTSVNLPPPLQTIYAMAISRVDLPLALYLSQLCKARWARVSRTTGEPIQPVVLQGNMDHHSVGRWVLECYEDSEQTPQRHLLNHFHAVLSFGCGASGRKSTQGARCTHSRSSACCLEQTHNTVPELLHSSRPTSIHKIQASSPPHCPAENFQLQGARCGLDVL